MVLDTLIKIGATKNTTPPNSWKEYCKFIGLVSYYWDMWWSLSHTLEPPINWTSSRVKFKYKDTKHKLFEKVEQIVAHNTLLDYPYCSIILLATVPLGVSKL